MSLRETSKQRNVPNQTWCWEMGFKLSVMLFQIQDEQGLQELQIHQQEKMEKEPDISLTSARSSSTSCWSALLRVEQQVQ
jgi:hypothetical protein